MIKLGHMLIRALDCIN